MNLDGGISRQRERLIRRRMPSLFALETNLNFDFGGRLSADGEGFAAFGKATKGIEILQKILEPSIFDETMTAEIKIQRIE